MGEEVQKLITLFGGLGGTGMMIVFGWAIYTGRLVLKREKDRSDALLAEMQVDRDRWMELALDATHRTTALVDTTREAIKVAGSEKRADGSKDGGGPHERQP